jgi:hypothetical protein
VQDVLEVGAVIDQVLVTLASRWTAEDNELAGALRGCATDLKVPQLKKPRYCISHSPVLQLVPAGARLSRSAWSGQAPRIAGWRSGWAPPNPRFLVNQRFR